MYMLVFLYTNKNSVGLTQEMHSERDSDGQLEGQAVRLSDSKGCLDTHSET